MEANSKSSSWTVWNNLASIPILQFVMLRISEHWWNEHWEQTDPENDGTYESATISYQVYFKFDTPPMLGFLVKTSPSLWKFQLWFILSFKNCGFCDFPLPPSPLLWHFQLPTLELGWIFSGTIHTISWYFYYDTQLVRVPDNFKGKVSIRNFNWSSQCFLVIDLRPPSYPRLEHFLLPIHVSF